MAFPSATMHQFNLIVDCILVFVFPSSPNIQILVYCLAAELAVPKQHAHSCANQAGVCRWALCSQTQVDSNSDWLDYAILCPRTLYLTHRIYYQTKVCHNYKPWPEKARCLHSSGLGKCCLLGPTLLTWTFRLSPNRRPHHHQLSDYPNTHTNTRKTQ